MTRLPLLAALILSAPIVRAAEPALAVEPAEFTLRGADSIQRLLVSGPALTGGDGRQFDYSRTAVYVSSNPKIATVSTDGVVLPHGDGTTEIRITLGSRSTVAKATVVGYSVETPISFRNQVIPAFTKMGCNAGGCHGKASGQNGFKLSLLGFDADFDYNAVVKEARGRRIFPASPDNSLLLTKASGTVPHGGGRKLATTSPEYDVLRRWVHQGTPAGSAADPHVTKIEVFPKDRVVGRQAEQQLIVTATYSDGTTKDVTRVAQYKSNEADLATVDEAGLVRTLDSTGDTAIMARYMGQVNVCRVSIPLTDAPMTALSTIPKKNYIDELVQAKWQQLKLEPSPVADDATFLRRAFLDAIGTLPTPEEVRAFQADNDPKKREKWIDKILARNEYADYWAVKWGDLLRNQRKGQKENTRGTFAFHAWIRNAFATNMPYDKFVRAIIAAQGTVDQHPPVIWYRSVRNATHQTNDTAQLFLGTRINCAQCHHHPYEKWGQDDYYKLQAFFGRMGRKSGESSAEPAIFVKADGGGARNPATGKVMQPQGLDGPVITIDEDEDPRHKLVDWMAAPENPYFSKAISNRLWAHFMGRGLVEPIDDMRVTNPPSNPELMDALAKDLFDHKFDLKHLIRTIMLSSTYQLESDPTPANIHDKQNYARAYPRRMLAEVMLDAIGDVTGTEESFNGLPKKTRAIQLPDESIGSYFLDVFGRPTRETPCECERPREANLAQSLHLLNSTDIQKRIGDPKGRIAAMVKAKKSDAEVTDELYLVALGRSPRADEKTKILEYLKGETDKKSAYEDLLWALLNTKEFLFNH